MSFATMSVTAALQARMSVRAFKDTEVPPQVLEEVFTLAQRVPRAGDSQIVRASWLTR